MKICFALGANPGYLGGVSQYLNNLLDSQVLSGNDITWIYKGSKNKEYKKNGINYIEIKVPKIYILDEFLFNRLVGKMLTSREFDVINSHAIWGCWMNNYKKKKAQKIIHTYHGSTYHFFKSHLRRFSLVKRVLYFPTLIYSYFIEKPPIKYADEIIYVSNKVQNQLEDLFGKAKKSLVIRTGVDIQKFKRKSRDSSFKKTKLSKNYFYGIHVGRGGYWTKGLDHAVKLSREIYNIQKNFRLIVVGSDKTKTKKYLDEPFVIYVEKANRDLMPYYYSSAEFLFCMSRYEGGAPTLSVSEAMASECLVVCSKDSKMEIIKDNINGLIVKNFDKGDASRVIEIHGNEKRKIKMRKEALKNIKELSIDKWAMKYLREFYI